MIDIRPSPPNPLTLDALSLSQWQSCRRRWLLEQSWRVVRWRPKSLLDACLRRGIFELSQCPPGDGPPSPASIVQSCRTMLMSKAANPGMDLPHGADPWTIANDLTGVLSTVLTALSRRTLLRGTRPGSIALSPESELTGLSWQPLSWADDSGALHRWITVDAWDDAELQRHLHSWAVIGDMALLDAPMTLHVVEIGQRKNGRQQSPWCRAYRHPAVPKIVKFQRVDGKGGHRRLLGDWKPHWYADQAQPDSVAWVDLMDAEGVTPSLLHHLAIAQPSETAASACREQILLEAQRMARRLAESAAHSSHPGSERDPAAGMAEPMARGSCHANHSDCPWIDACYREYPARGIGELGLYQLLTSAGAGRSFPPSFALPATTSS